MTISRAIDVTTAIPRTVEDLTPAWFTAALQDRLPGATVDDVDVLEVRHGTCTKIRVGLSGTSADEGRRIPPSVMVKTGFEPHSERMAGMHMTEMRAYRDYLPTVAARAPTCYFAGADEENHTVVVMEDLVATGVTFLSLQKPIGFDLARAYLDNFAAQHARWWGSPELEAGGAFDWVNRPVEGRYVDYMNQLTTGDTFQAYLDAPRGAATPVALHDGGRLCAGLIAMRDSYKDQPRTIVHGDSHLNNLYLDAEGRPAFLDWSVRCAPFQHELSYFLTAALDVPDRRKWEQPLLQHYLEQLASHGVTPPSFDQAWLGYQRDVMWGFFIWLLNASVFQTESANTAAAARFATAMIDHDTYGKLGV